MGMIENTYCPGVPAQKACGEGTCLMAVLIRTDHPNGTFDDAVYVGIVNLTVLCPDHDDTEEHEKYKESRAKAAKWVYACGAKQSYAKACGYFMLKEENYRR